MIVRMNILYLKKKLKIKLLNAIKLLKKILQR